MSVVEAFSKLRCKPRKVVNRYVRRIQEFPGRILLFDDPTLDQNLIKSALNSSPVIVEIGSGSGEHLITLAKREPQSICFGFELRYKRCVRTIEKCDYHNVANLMVLHMRAEALAELFPSGSIDRLVVNFPDPWEKKGWRKNRILSATFLDMAVNTLKPTGFLTIKTDCKGYLSDFLSVARADHRFRVAKLTTDLYRSEFLAENVQTEFERMFLSQKIPICFMELMLAELHQC